MEDTTNIFQQLSSKNNTIDDDQFVVDDLLNLSNDELDNVDGTIISDINLDSTTENSTTSSSVSVVNSYNSSSSIFGCDTNLIPHIGCDPIHLSGDIRVPDEELAELEWLSNFVEDSFSSDDLQKMQMITGMQMPNKEKEEANEFSQLNRNNPIFNKQVSVPAKARSKRTRVPPCDWSSRLLVLSPTSDTSETELLIPTPTLPFVTPPPKKAKTNSRKKDSSDEGSGGDGRRCLHCATDKTPQWRTGPKGPKTLCNACGVRYKSGRLVPEYRPAASPTFVLTKHSNSHRKVLELQRQKELRIRQHQHNQFLQHQNMIYEMSNTDDCLIHQHVGADFRRLI